MGVGIEGEKHRSHFEGLGLLVVAVATHLSFAVTLGAMRVGRLRGPPKLAQTPAAANRRGAQDERPPKNWQINKRLKIEVVDSVVDRADGDRAIKSTQVTRYRYR